MRRYLMPFVLILVCSMLGSAAAQDGGDAATELENGFQLGKFYVSANMLASDLEIIQVLDETFDLEQITDENYQTGVINDDDLAGAQMFLGYSLWRLQFMVLPVCQAGLEEDSFSEAAIAPYKDEAQALLASLANDVNAFLAVGDFASLAAFVDATLEAGYVPALSEMANRAQADAGVEEEGGEAASAEAPAEPEA